MRVHEIIPRGGARQRMEIFSESTIARRAIKFRYFDMRVHEIIPCGGARQRMEIFSESTIAQRAIKFRDAGRLSVQITVRRTVICMRTGIL